MSTLDWFIVVACWMLIPAVIALKAWRDIRDAKAQRALSEACIAWKTAHRARRGGRP